MYVPTQYLHILYLQSSIFDIGKSKNLITNWLTKEISIQHNIVFFFKNEILWNNLYIFFKIVPASCSVCPMTTNHWEGEKSIFKIVKICFCPENKTKEVNKTYSKWFLKSISRIFYLRILKKYRQLLYKVLINVS